MSQYIFLFVFLFPSSCIDKRGQRFDLSPSYLILLGLLSQNSFFHHQSVVLTKLIISYGRRVTHRKQVGIKPSKFVVRPVQGYSEAKDNHKCLSRYEKSYDCSSWIIRNIHMNGKYQNNQSDDKIFLILAVV